MVTIQLELRPLELIKYTIWIVAIKSRASPSGTLWFAPKRKIFNYWSSWNNKNESLHERQKNKKKPITVPLRENVYKSCDDL